MTDTSIKAGQIYRCCAPRGGPRIRIESYTPGAARAQVVDAETSKRPREVLVSHLHASPVTDTGRRRRAGYVLEGRFLPVLRDSEPAEQELDKVLRIVATWYCAVNDGSGFNANDLAWDLEKAGYPLPDVPEDVEDADA
ncbi:hypothetical protein AB0H73_15000 [Streptomyces olivoreticuli]